MDRPDKKEANWITGFILGINRSQTKTPLQLTKRKGAPKYKAAQIITKHTGILINTTTQAK